MTLSVPSFLAAAISALIPPPAAADVATAQEAGRGDGEAERVALAAGVCGRDEFPAGRWAACEQPAAANASAADPATSGDNLMKRGSPSASSRSRTQGGVLELALDRPRLLSPLDLVAQPALARGAAVQ